MLKEVTKKDAKAALSEYFLRDKGVILGRKSGIEIVDVEDGKIRYRLATGEEKTLKAFIRTEYVFDLATAPIAEGSFIPVQTAN